MFDFIHRSSKNLKHEKDAGEVKAKMSYLANQRRICDCCNIQDGALCDNS